MLRGDNGILNRSAEAKFANSMAQFDEQTKLASMAVRTSIEANKVSKAGYIATYNGTEPDAKNYFTGLANDVAKELGVTALPISSSQSANIETEGYTVGYYLDKEGSTTQNGNGYIVIWYTDNGLKSTMDREKAITNYGLTDVASEGHKTANEAVLVRVIEVENYKSELSDMGLTSIDDGNKDLKRTTGNVVENITNPNGNSTDVPSTASQEPGLHIIGSNTFVSWEDLVKLGNDNNDTSVTTTYKKADVTLDDEHTITRFSWNADGEETGYLVIPNGITSLGENAFYDCSALTSLTIPNGVTSIGNFAFSGCSALTSLTIPNSVTSIGYNPFRGCSSIENLTLSNNLDVDDGLAVLELNQLQDLKALNISGKSPFLAKYYDKEGNFDISYLASDIEVDEEVINLSNEKLIGMIIHAEYSSLQNEFISWNDLVNIGKYAKGDISEVDEENVITERRDVHVYYNEENKRVEYLTGPNDSEWSLFIPDDGSVHGLGSISEGGDNLVYITLPNSISYIEPFGNLNKLKKLTLPSSLAEHISFAGHDSLEKLYIPSTCPFLDAYKVNDTVDIDEVASDMGVSSDIVELID